jgi:N4-gp56 family major capsid protein
MTWAVGTQAANLGRASGVSSGAAAKDIKTLYKANYLLNREPELVYQQFAQKQANMDIPLNKGDNIEFTRYAPLTTSTTHNLLVEGTEPDAEAYYAQTVNAVLDEYGNFVQPSSRVWLTAFDPKLGGLARLLGIQSGKSLDLKIQQVLAQGFIGMRAD